MSAKSKKFLFMMMGMGTFNPDALTFDAAIIVTSAYAFGASGATGILLATNDMSQRVERLNLIKISGVVKKDRDVFAISDTELYMSFNDGNTFIKYNDVSPNDLSLTNAFSLDVSGNKIYISDSNGLFTADFTTLQTEHNSTFTPVISSIKRLGGRTYFAQHNGTGIYYSDDGINNPIAATTSPGVNGSVCIVRPFDNGLVYMFNGVPQISTDNGETYTELVNFPSGSVYCDFQTGPGNILMVVHSEDGVYRSFSYTSTANFTLTAPVDTPQTIALLKDRFVVSGGPFANQGVFISVDEGASWVFTASSELGGSNGMVSTDDSVYLRDEASRKLVGEPGHALGDFMVEELPLASQFGFPRAWFSSKLQPAINTDGKTMLAATDITGFNAPITLDTAPYLYEKTEFQDQTTCFTDASNALVFDSVPQLDTIWANGGGTIACVVQPFTTGSQDVIASKATWNLLVRDSFKGKARVRFENGGGGQEYVFGTVNRVLILDSNNSIVVTWNSDTPNTLPRVWVNDGEVTMVKNSGGGTADDGSSGVLILGNTDTGTEGFSGELLEFFVYDRILPDDIIKDIDTALATVYDGGDSDISHCFPAHLGINVGWYNCAYSPFLNPAGGGTFADLSSQTVGDAMIVTEGTPTVVTNVQNDRPIINLAIPDVLEIPRNVVNEDIFDGGGGGTFAMAFRFTDFDGAFGGTLLHKGFWRLFLQDKTATGGGLRYTHLSTGNTYSYETSGQVLSFTDANVVQFSWDALTPSVAPTLYINGELVNMVVHTVGSGSPFSDAANEYTIGGDVGPIDHVEMELFEIVLSDQAYTEEENLNIYSYFKQQWSL